MSNKQLRDLLRLGHIGEGVLIAIFIYSPTLRANPTYASFIQFVVVPFIVVSGVALWQQPRINKWRNKRRAA